MPRGDCNFPIPTQLFGRIIDLPCTKRPGHDWFKNSKKQRQRMHSFRASVMEYPRRERLF